MVGISPYNQEVLHLKFLLLWSKVSKDGARKSIDSYCQAVGVVLMS